MAVAAAAVNEFSPSYYSNSTESACLVEASLIGSEIKRIVDMQHNKCEVIRTCITSRIVAKCLDISFWIETTDRQKLIKGLSTFYKFKDTLI